ncbi:hypothetical protein B0H67DRAFT_82427 [Lasiosphaeris hirsuta]|uniref:Secreted protein n=1 Tax=Lasiosphaeris hirsuta TaxID=260670 RepID=A0AA40EBV8_9PEZI|nr:hypothetical protein B0H67DRAFT_82427 [Lasiosphaeris hirsuta]
MRAVLAWRLMMARLVAVAAERRNGARFWEMNGFCFHLDWYYGIAHQIPSMLFPFPWHEIWRTPCFGNKYTKIQRHLGSQLAQQHRPPSITARRHRLGPAVCGSAMFLFPLLPVAKTSPLNPSPICRAFATLMQPPFSIGPSSKLRLPPIFRCPTFCMIFVPPLCPCYQPPKKTTPCFAWTPLCFLPLFELSFWSVRREQCVLQSWK